MRTIMYLNLLTSRRMSRCARASNIKIFTLFQKYETEKGTALRVTMLTAGGNAPGDLRATMLRVALNGSNPDARKIAAKIAIAFSGGTTLTYLSKVRDCFSVGEALPKKITKTSPKHKAELKQEYEGWGRPGADEPF